MKKRKRQFEGSEPLLLSSYRFIGKRRVEAMWERDKEGEEQDGER